MSEHKYFLTSVAKTDAVLTDTPPFSLTLIPPGIDEISRIGDVVTCTSLECRYIHFGPRSYSAQRFTQSRFIGFVWKDDTVPGIADLMDTIYPISNAQIRCLLPLNHQKKVSRKILWDFQLAEFHDGLSPSNWQALSGNGMAKCGRFVINLTKLKGGLNQVHFNPSLTTGRNHIYAMILCNTNGGATNGGTNFQMQYKVTFVDS